MSLDQKRAGRLLAVTVLVLAVGACSRGPMHHGHGQQMAPPAAQEFGLGPRASDDGLYRVTAEPAEPIRTGRMHGWTIRVEDAAGTAVDGAGITVDGGMPQHGHGLPTRPRVTRALGGGAYQVDGMRFNMGGWWVVTFDIVAAAGTDRVTFNIDL